VNYGLSVAPQNRWEHEDGVGHASRSSGLLHVKQVGLGLPSLGSRLMEAGRIWRTWHHHRGCIELKLKTDGSMRQATRPFADSFGRPDPHNIALLLP
jgi:hypothetical protein